MGAGASGAANAPPAKINVERVFDSESVSNNSDLVFQKRNNKRRDNDENHYSGDVNTVTKNGNSNGNKTNTKSGNDFVFPDDDLRNSPQMINSVTRSHHHPIDSTRVDDIEDDDNTSVLSYGDNEKEVMEDLENLESSINSIGSIVPPLSENLSHTDKIMINNNEVSIKSSNHISVGGSDMVLMPHLTPQKLLNLSPTGSTSLQKSPAESISSLDSYVEIMEDNNRLKGGALETKKGAVIKSKPHPLSSASQVIKQPSQESKESSVDATRADSTRQRPIAASTVPSIDTTPTNIPTYQKALSPINEAYLSSPRPDIAQKSNQRYSNNNNQSKTSTMSPRIASFKEMPYNMKDESPSSKAVRAIVESSANFLVDLEDSLGSVDSLEASSATIDAESSLRLPLNNIADNTKRSGRQRRGSKGDASGKKEGDAKKVKRESLHRYLDMSTQAGNDRSEAIMGLQRQKIWSYAQNAQLQREVDLLQKQLEALESMENQMESSKAAKSSANGNKTQHEQKSKAVRSAIANNSSNESLVALERDGARPSYNPSDPSRFDKESNGMPFKSALSSLHRQQQNPNPNRSNRSADIDGTDDATSLGAENPLTSLPSTIVGRNGGWNRRGRQGLSKAKSTSNREQRMRRQNFDTDEEDYNFSEGDSGADAAGSTSFAKKFGKDSSSGAASTNSNFYDFDAKALEHHHLDVILEKKSASAARDVAVPKASVARGRGLRASRDKALLEKGDALDRALSLAADSKVSPSNISGAVHDMRLKAKDSLQRKQQYPSDSEHHHYNLSSDFEDDGYASIASNGSMTFTGQPENKNGQGGSKPRKPNRFKKPAGNDDSSSNLRGGYHVPVDSTPPFPNINIDNDNDSVGGLSATEAQHAKKAKSKNMLLNLNRRRRRTMDGNMSEQDSVTEDEDNASISGVNDMAGMFNALEHKSSLSGERKLRRKHHRARGKGDHSDAKSSISHIEDKDAFNGAGRKNKLWTRALDTRWGEVNLLLRKKIDCDEDIQYTVAAAEAGLMFTDQLNNVAKTLDVLRGTLSRWLLPYDNNTRIDEQCSTPHSVLENMPDSIRGKISERQIHYLVAGANSVRKLVRIKIADDNDLEQARQALKTALDFFRRLQEDSADAGITPYQLLMMRDD